MKQAKPVEKKTNSEIVADAKAAGRIAQPVHPKVDQEFFEDEAAILAEDLGFNGADDDEIDGVSCATAKRFLTKTLHEIHVAVLFPHCKMPEADDVAAAIMLHDDPESMKLLKAKLSDVEKRERETAKATA